MNMKSLCLLPLIAALTACAHQGVGESQASAQAPADSAVTSHVGLGIESLPAKAVTDYMAGEFKALNKVLAESDATKWQLTQLGDGSIRLQAASAVGFDTDSAELRPSSLDTLAGIAKVAQTFNKTTVHVLANGRDATAVAFNQSLSDRRAAALAAYLNAQGIDDLRLRFEGAANARPGVLQILIKPIVTGAEPQAWMSPA